MVSSPIFEKTENISQYPVLINKINVKPTGNGILDKLTFAVKDVIDIKGQKTSCGNPTWLSQQLICDVHAICIEQLLASGAMCLGKTVLGEFGSGSTGVNHFYGMPKNPKAPDRVPGGSSSGSASIVAEGIVDFALGTDAAGSVRVPASFCGIYGMRLSHGIVSMSGVKNFAPSFDTLGIFSKTIEIQELVFETLVGRNLKKQIDTANKFYVLEDYFMRVSPDQRKIFYQFINKSCDVLQLKPTFIKLTDIHPDIYDAKTGISAIFRIILCSEIWTTIGSWAKVNLEFSKTTYVDFSYMAKIDRTLLLEAFKRKELYADRLNTLLSPGSILCIPSAPDVAPFRNKEYKQVNEFDYDKLRPLVALSSLGKLPQINIPVEPIGSLPFGISFLSNHNQDYFLIQAVKKIIAGKY
ncbi:MAG: amidase family protein [Legionella sp.]|nr:amidase family protein [Legionella sp.]